MFTYDQILEAGRALAEEGSDEVQLFPGGMFVGDATFRKGFAERFSSDAGADKIWRGLLKKHNWEWYYWVSGKTCLPGLVIREQDCVLPDSLKPAKDDIHDQDPYFADKRDWVRILIHVEYAAEVKINDDWIKIPKKVLSEFSRLYSDLSVVKPLKRSHESVGESIARDRLRVLLKMLSKSEPVSVTHGVFVQQMRRSGIIYYRKYRNVIFCMSRDALDGIILDHELHDPSCLGSGHDFINVDAVFEALREILNTRRAPKTVRLNRKGIFIAQKAFKKFASVYAEHDGGAPIGSAKKKLKKLTKGEIVYLIDGDRSHFGILLPIPVVVEAFGWAHRDDIIFGKSMILADDPLFNSNQGIGLPMRSKCIARVQVGDQLYHVSFHAFTRFLERAGERAHEFKRKGNYDVVNRRGYLMLMHDLFRKSEPAIRLNAAKQLLKHQMKDARIRITNNWVWVILEDNTIITCFYRNKAFKSVFRRKKHHRVASVGDES